MTPLQHFVTSVYNPGRALTGARGERGGEGSFSRIVRWHLEVEWWRAGHCVRPADPPLIRRDGFAASELDVRGEMPGRSERESLGVN